MSGFSLSPLATNIQDIVNVIRQLMQGRSNSVGTVTLRAGHTTTVVTVQTDPAAANMAPGCEVFYAAKTAHAGAIPLPWTSAKGFGTFTVNHVSDANSDKIFAFLIQGNA